MFRSFTMSRMRQVRKMSSSFVLSEEVSRALGRGGAVVALESTIITHGLPWPANFQCAALVEAVVRAHGATPATIAILDGVAHVGLSSDQLERLAVLDSASVRKCSRRDLAPAIALGEAGSTTVAGTMVLAAKAGINVFATGGLGGVHRGAYDSAEPSCDVSADLTELGRTPVAVVCSGVKSILDVGRTLEVLETEGVTVVSMESPEFPSFFTRGSGHNAPLHLDSAAEVAAVLRANLDLGLESGMVVAVPNPEPLDEAEVQSAIADALRAAEDAGIAGKAVTPFLLKEIQQHVGDSVSSNIALVKHNAAVAAQIAGALCADGGGTDAGGGVMLLGGATVDMVGRAAPGGELIMGTSNPLGLGGSVRHGFGGVARNVAEALAHLVASSEAPLAPPKLLSAVGADELGERLIRDCIQCGIDVAGGAVLVNDDEARRTAVYFAVLDGRGELLTALADMDVLGTISEEHVDSHRNDWSAAPLAVLDANAPVATLRRACELCAAGGTPVVLEPTSVPKAARVAAGGALRHVHLVTPNEDELYAMLDAAPETAATEASQSACTDRQLQVSA